MGILRASKNWSRYRLQFQRFEPTSRQQCPIPSFCRHHMVGQSAFPEGVWAVSSDGNVDCSYCESGNVGRLNAGVGRIVDVGWGGRRG